MTVNRFRELAQKILLLHPNVDARHLSVPSEVVDALATVIGERFGAPLLPAAGESVAVTLDSPKTAALFFDRVWHPPAMDDSAPRDAIFYGATDFEVWPLAVVLAMKPPKGLDWERVQSAFGADGPIAQLWAQRGVPAARTYCDVLSRERGIHAVPIYKSIEEYEQDYHPGSTELLVAALDGLNVVDESRLTWSHVGEFRADSAAKAKLRRLRHWLDASMIEKPVSFVRDELAVRLEDYDWALRKHGINTLLGTASEVLDPRFLAGTAAASAGLALAGMDFWAAVGMAGALLGRVALSVSTRLVDLRDSRRRSEVAIISELKRLTPQTSPRRS